MKNSANFTIRPLTAADKPQLLEIMTAFYNSPALLHHTPRRVLSRVIDDCVGDMPFLCGYAAVDGSNTILGYTMHSVGYSTEYGGICVTVEDLYVAPEHRGLGTGKALLDFADTAHKGAVRVRLEVARDNVSAAELYSRHGYTDIEYRQMGKILGGDDIAE